jgi:hypothetical protein
MFGRLPSLIARNTIQVMEATTTREAEFLELNSQRINALRSVLKAAEHATESCNLWLQTGHTGDYRAWQTQLRWLEEADREYRKIPRSSPR